MLIYHNIFMKRITLIVVILNHSGIFFWGNFYVCVAFQVFFPGLKTFFFIFIKNNFLVTQIFKSLTVKYHFFLTRSTYFLITNIEMIQNIFFMNVDKKKKKKISLKRKICCVFGGGPLNTLKLFFWQIVKKNLSTYMKICFLQFQKKWR